MGNKKVKLMTGVNDLINEIKDNSNIIFSCTNPAFLSKIDRENDSHLRILIPDQYWNTQFGKFIESRLMLKNTPNDNQPKRSVRSELSNLLTGTDGHTGVKTTRSDLAKDLAKEEGFSLLLKQKEFFDICFAPNLIHENFSVKCLPSVYKSLTSFHTTNKRSIKNDLDWYHVSIFCKTLLFLCSTRKYSDFFWWLFLYALFQKDIVAFSSHFPQTQYKTISDMLNNAKSPKELFDKSQVLDLSEEKFWAVRKKLVQTASEHLIITGPSLKDAFNIDADHSLISALTDVLNTKFIKKVSILITDPIIFDSHISCGEPIRDISGTIESLQEHFYSIFERNKIDLHIYFLPLLQIDHAVITEEFMLFRSNKLWNHERKYKGAFNLYLANYYIPTSNSSSEYLAHKEYLSTIMENCTTIYPSMDINHSLLSETSAKSKHMHWRRHLESNDLHHIYFHKLYEKQLFSYVCNTWNTNNKLIGQFTPSTTILHANTLFDPKVLLNDDTQKVLLPYLSETKNLFDKALKKHDPSPSSYCQIFPSLDLGIPNNVQRLAGGFATGMLITWQCGLDIVLIDATVNVCTSSVFKLNHFNLDLLKQEEALIHFLKSCFDDASSAKGYSFSFTSGNHFLIIAQNAESQEFYLVLHSSANELKNSYMGLYPVEGNWYADYRKDIIGENGRYFHYLKDEEARHFIRMAQNFKTYNEQIHQWLAKRINNNAPFKESDMLIKHHYYMPTENSIALGTFAEPVGTHVPIFSAPGRNIYIFEIGKDNWQVNLGGSKGNVCLVPHGWGQKIDNLSSIHINNGKLVLVIGNNERTFSISSKDHINCSEKSLRTFNTEEDFLKLGKSVLKGTIIKTLIPLFEYSATTQKK